MTDPLDSIREFRAVGNPPSPYGGTARRRPRSSLGVAAAVLFVSALAVGIGLQMRDGSSDENVSAQEPPATETTQGDDAGVPSDPEGIVAMARRAGERTGDESPTDIEWVYSTREAAVMHVSDTHLAGTADAEVLVVQMQGQFEVTVSHQEQPLEGEEPRPNPTGRALVIVAELESGIITDRVVLPAPVDLSQLGEVAKAP